MHAGRFDCIRVEQFARENVLKAPGIEEAMDFMRKVESKQIEMAG